MAFHLTEVCLTVNHDVWSPPVVCLQKVEAWSAWQLGTRARGGRGLCRPHPRRLVERFLLWRSHKLHLWEGDGDLYVWFCLPSLSNASFHSARQLFEMYYPLAEVSWCHVVLFCSKIRWIVAVATEWPPWNEQLDSTHVALGHWPTCEQYVWREQRDFFSLNPKLQQQTCLWCWRGAFLLQSEAKSIFTSKCNTAGPKKDNKFFLLQITIWFLYIDI